MITWEKRKKSAAIILLTRASKVSKPGRARCEDTGEQILYVSRQWWVDVFWESPVSCLLKGSCNLMVDPKRVSVINPVCSSPMSSSVPHKIAALKEAVPVPFRHT